MQIAQDQVLAPVAKYYGDKVSTHGATHLGVDWNSQASQELRFAQLLRAAPTSLSFSVNDLGCGYGHLADYAARQGLTVDYRGIDVAEKMIDAARVLHANLGQCQFSVASAFSDAADISVASGIFNVRLAADDATWLAHIHRTIDHLFEMSEVGCAFNCLTAYSDADKKRDYLYYADPLALFDYCRKRFGRHIALLHDYGLYEFTLIVRKHV